MLEPTHTKLHPAEAFHRPILCTFTEHGNSKSTLYKAHGQPLGKRLEPPISRRNAASTQDRNLHCTLPVCDRRTASSATLRNMLQRNERSVRYAVAKINAWI